MRFAAFARWIAALGLLGLVAACGRAGDLEPPPTAAPVAAQEGQVAPDEDAVEDKPFILDGLL